MPYTPPPSHKARLLWICALGLILQGLLAAFFNPVTQSFGFHGDLEEMHWTKMVTPPKGVQPGSEPVPQAVPYAPGLMSYWQDIIICSLILGFLAWKAPRTTAWPQWVALILLFAVMSNNIQLGLKELSMVAGDKVDDFKYLWFLCVLHWLTGLWLLGCMMPLLLFLRRDLPFSRENPVA